MARTHHTAAVSDTVSLATWGEALPNLYLGGTGTVYHEPWQDDFAEIIVCARLLTDKERTQVEDYLGKKYGVAITR